MSSLKDLQIALKLAQVYLAQKNDSEFCDFRELVYCKHASF